MDITNSMQSVNHIQVNSQAYTVLAMGDTTQPIGHTTQDLGHTTQDLGHTTQDLGHTTQDLGQATQNLAQATQDINNGQATQYTFNLQPMSHAGNVLSHSTGATDNLFGSPAINIRFDENEQPFMDSNQSSGSEGLFKFSGSSSSFTPSQCSAAERSRRPIATPRRSRASRSSISSLSSTSSLAGSSQTSFAQPMSYPTSDTSGELPNVGNNGSNGSNVTNSFVGLFSITNAEYAPTSCQLGLTNLSPPQYVTTNMLNGPTSTSSAILSVPQSLPAHRDNRLSLQEGATFSNSCDVPLRWSADTLSLDHGDQLSQHPNAGSVLDPSNAEYPVAHVYPLQLKVLSLLSI